MSEPLRNLSDDDIRKMAREAEQENYRLDPPHRKPKGFHIRRASIKLNLIPLPELTLEELVWVFQEAIARANGKGRAGR